VNAVIALVWMQYGKNSALLEKQPQRKSSMFTHLRMQTGGLYNIVVVSLRGRKRNETKERQMLLRRY
jgi:hypothetical protein